MDLPNDFENALRDLLSDAWDAGYEAAKSGDFTVENPYQRADAPWLNREGSK